MKGTNPILSAANLGNTDLTLTSNCLPSNNAKYSPLVVTPPENGHSSRPVTTKSTDPPRRNGSLMSKTRVTSNGTTPHVNGSSFSPKRPFTTLEQKHSHAINGRSSLKPCQLQSSSHAPPRVHSIQQEQLLSRTLGERLFGNLSLQQVKEEPLDYPTRIETPLMAPVLASSSVMADAAATKTDTQQDNNSNVIESAHQTAKSISSLALADVLSVSVRYKLPQLFLKRTVRRHFTRRKVSIKFQTKTHHRQRMILTRTQFRRVCGIPNLGGQSCFLNCVLQALASLAPFCVYLQRIVQMQYQKEDLDETLHAMTKNSINLSLCELLVMNLQHLNGSLKDNLQNKVLDPREILFRVCQEHAQFRPRHGGFGRLHVGTEQQDAQELLQALLGMIISDAGLDGTKSTQPQAESRVVNAPFDFSFMDNVSCSEEAEDSILSLSSFLTRVEMEQQDKDKEESPSVNGVSSTSKTLQASNGYIAHGQHGGHHVGKENGNLPREEKKQEDFELETPQSSLPLQYSSLASSLASSRGEKSMEEAQQQLSASTLNMLKTLSPMTPSPLSGWIGSTLQCCTCHHVRPIQNAPFLDIPIVPTSVSKYLSGRTRIVPSSPLPACSLNQCLRDFTSVERVTNVECRSCTIKREKSQLEEEIFMLCGAVETVLSRLQRQREKQGPATTNGGDEHVKAMKDELETAKARYTRLINIDVDGEVDIVGEVIDKETGSGVFLEDGSDILATNSERPGLVRGDAKKCLLLTRMPSVLCLHVQRRYYDPARNCMSKTLQHIDFPEILDVGLHCAYGSNGAKGLTGRGGNDVDLSKDMDRHHKPIPYKLMSIIEHRGNAHAGHYQTYRRAPPHSKKEWVLVSDLSVTALDWKHVKRCQAYMLFYEAI